MNKESAFLINRAGLSALVTIVWALVMFHYLSLYPDRHVFHVNVDSPVLALELSHDARDIDSVLHRTSPPKYNAQEANMTLLNHLDWVFIPLYAFSLWSFARIFTANTRLLTIAVIATAFFDYVEDFQISRALNGANPAIDIPSLLKWGLLGLVFILMSRILEHSESSTYSLPTRRLLAIGYFVAGVLILTDVLLGHWTGYTHISLGVSLFSALLLMNVIAFIGQLAVRRKPALARSSAASA